MTRDADFDEQVASRPAVHAGLALILDAHRDSVIDACRDLNVNFLFLRPVPCSVAVCALLTNNSPASPALGADSLRLHHAEDRLLRRDDTSCAMASRTGLWRCSGFCSGALAGRALFPKIDLDLFRASEDRFLKADADARAHVRAPHRRIRI